ncbi:PepSY domain-containing protein [Paenirhodobacter enshiensis]|uniref:PepSY domain-containing protein n=1 Tax=Paenirhodobacter enshiensis TaxID=1105367 RepID=A0A086XS42_9RHOB|nr:PepSY domain-containing protein [Paenirhodobacter enshiensis]KFI24842.1 hypothetical protein CG50_07545 [Paenirhodobacter enshiensis]
MPNPPRVRLLPALVALLALATLPHVAAAEDAECHVPMSDWQPRAAVQALAESRGLTVRHIKIDDGCYEVHALDAQGRDIELMLDPATLAVLSSEVEGQNGHGYRHDTPTQQER